ncbi:MAG: hypothetical protein ACOX7B_10510 [Christensenellales bacterium]
MLNSEMVKEAALAAGADLCGIGSMDRFANAPPEMDPRRLYPNAKSIIGMAFRIPRGVQRGIEEGTQFFQYPSMAYGGINEIYAPAVLYSVGCLIEDHGFVAYLNRNTGGRGTVSDMDGTHGWSLSPEVSLEEADKIKGSDKKPPRTIVSRPLHPGSEAPDVQIHFRLAAVACGLGEIGLSKMLLTPQFGPLQRLAFLFTNAELEPDPLYDGPKICRNCKACIRECPGGCLDPIERVKAVVGDKVCEWAKLDEWRCFAFYTYPGRYYDPFVPKEVFDKNEDGILDVLEHGKQADGDNVEAIYRALSGFFPTHVGYNMAKCGGCIRACVSMLEKPGGCLAGRFENPLRSGKPWRLDR